MVTLRASRSGWRTTVAMLLVSIAAGPTRVQAAVDPGPDGSTLPTRTRWQNAPSDADKQAALLMMAVDRAFDVDDPRAALTLLAKLRDLRPKDPTVQNNIGYALGRVGDVIGAATAFQKSVALDPAYAQGAFNLAAALVDLDRLDEARRCLQAWVPRVREYPAMGLLLAKIEQARGRSAAARSLVDQVLAAPKIKPLVLFETANLLKNRNDRRAEDAFRRVMAEDPEMIGAPLSLVSIFRTSGRFKEARQILDDLAKQRPDHPSVLRERGILNAQESRLEEAVFDLDRAMALKPELTDAAILAATCLVRLGRRDEAVLRLDLVLDPIRTVSAADREAARRLKDRLAVAFPRLSPVRPGVHEIRQALERKKDAQPKLEAIVWSGLASTAQERQAVVEYHIRGTGPVASGHAPLEVSIWIGQEPWRSGSRPRDCPEVHPTQRPQAWIGDVTGALKQQFPGTLFEVEENSVQATPGWHRFTAVGQPAPRAWLSIRGSCGPDGPPGGVDVVAWAHELLPTVLGRPPVTTLRAMRELTPRQPLESMRVFLRAVLAIPQAEPVLLDVVLHRNIEALLKGTPPLTRAQDPPVDREDDPWTQKVEWFDGLPAVRGWEESPIKEKGLELPGRGDLAVFVGCYEVSLSAWTATGIRELPGAMHHVLRLIFPELPAVGK